MLRVWNKKISGAILIITLAVGVYFFFQSIINSDFNIHRSLYVAGAALLFIISLIDFINKNSSVLKTGLLLATSIGLTISCIEPSLFISTWNYQLALLTIFLFISLYDLNSKRRTPLIILHLLACIGIVIVLLLKSTTPLFYNIIFLTLSILTASELAYVFLRKN